MRRSFAALSSQLTHFSDAGPRMVGIAAKPVTERLAIARAVVRFPEDVLRSLVDDDGQLAATAKVRLVLLAVLRATNRTDRTGLFF
jgi:molybdenum cofactor biosynthesis enzyme